MEESVKTQETAAPVSQENAKELNFRKLEASREEEREKRIRAEMEAQHLKQRIEALEQRDRPPEIDPLENLSTDDLLDPNRLKVTLQNKMLKERNQYKKEAEQMTRQILDEERKKDFMGRLKSNYRDYDDVMTQDNINTLGQSNPEFVRSLNHVSDDYERGELIYTYLKRNHKKEEPKPSIKDKVEENAKNPYLINSSIGTPAPSAIDFDVSSKAAREAAYARLKKAQKNPIVYNPMAQSAQQ